MREPSSNWRSDGALGTARASDAQEASRARFVEAHAGIGKNFMGLLEYMTGSVTGDFPIRI